MLFRLENLSATKNFASIITKNIDASFVVAVNGDLGVGKTTLIKYVLQSFGIIGSIKSPTFTLVEPYVLVNFTIYHFDLYRFSEKDEWYQRGFDEYLLDKNITFIEWAARGAIETIDWQIDITLQGDLRILDINAHSKKGMKCLSQLILHGANYCS